MKLRSRGDKAASRAVASPTSRVSWVAAIIRALDRRGLDGGEIALRAGIPSTRLDRDGDRVPVAGIGPLWRAAVAATGDDAFGFSAARQIHVGAFGPFAETLFSSESPYHALRRAARLASFLTEGVLVTLQDKPTTVRVSLDRVPQALLEDEAIDAGVATILAMVRMLAAPEPLDPVAVRLRRARPVAVDRFAKILRAPIAFGAARDVIEFRRDDLLRPTAAADALRARRAERLASGEITLWSARVRDRIGDRLIDGPPSERSIARELAVSTRALQLHLASEGTSYRAVLEATREALARAHLSEGALPVRWIASLLGFAHTSGFSRAFKQWTGVSPQEFARAAREGDRAIPLPRTRAGR